MKSNKKSKKKISEDEFRNKRKFEKKNQNLVL